MISLLEGRSFSAREERESAPVAIVNEEVARRLWPGRSAIGRSLVLVGAFRVSAVYAAIAATGVVFGAVYMLWMVLRVFFGPVTSEANREMPDLSLRELVVLLPIVIRRM